MMIFYETIIVLSIISRVSANLVDGAKCTPVKVPLGPGEDQKDTGACVVQSINDIFYCLLS